jgi:hypothetical protein
VSEFRYISAKDVEWFYSGLPSPFTSVADVVQFVKDAGTVTTQLSPSYYNIVYGAQVWAQINLEQNIFGILPKTTWPRSGWRAIASLSVTSESSLVTTETGTIPGPYYPGIKVLRTKPKIVATSFEISEVMEELSARSADDIWAGLNQLRIWYGREFGKQINALLGAKAVGSSSSDVPSLDPNSQLISLDQIVASQSEVTGVYGTAVPTTISNNINIYGLYRLDSDTWSGGVVIHNNGTPTSLTDNMIQTVNTQTMIKGANPAGRIWLTGPDTWAKINALYLQFVRYMPITEAKIAPGPMGWQYVDSGNEAGFRVAQLYGYPMVLSTDVAKDTISRIYLLDTTDFENLGAPRLGVAVLRPVEYFETNTQLFPVLRQFVFRGVYRFIGDTVARFLPGQGKIRDIQ